MNRITDAETGSESFGTATETEVNADDSPQAESRRIPIHGSFSRPATPEDGLKEMISGRQNWKRGNLKVNISTEEFTSVCPTTGLPDFNEVTIEYRPDKFYLESKTVKYYFYAYREYGAHCETLAQKILDDVRTAIDPLEIRVIVNQRPRGGLRIVSEAEWISGQQYMVSMRPVSGDLCTARSITVKNNIEINNPEVTH